jgi:hypothetical protein
MTAIVAWAFFVFQFHDLKPTIAPITIPFDIFSYRCRCVSSFRVRPHKCHHNGTHRGNAAWSVSSWRRAAGGSI